MATDRAAGVLGECESRRESQQAMNEVLRSGRRCALARKRAFVSGVAIAVEAPRRGVLRWSKRVDESGDWLWRRCCRRGRAQPFKLTLGT